MWMFIAAVIVLLIVAAVISYPLLFNNLESYALADLPDEDFSERDALLEALSDLEDSYRSGKLSETDYEAQRERLQVQYIEVVEGRAPGA